MSDNGPKGVCGFINNYIETNSLDLESMSYGEFRLMVIAFIKECEPTLNVFSSFLFALTNQVSASTGRILRSHLRVFTKELYTKSNITA